ncbi:hypothetical protein ABTG32_17635, partial [Acinetobacter baumannii]
MHDLDPYRTQSVITTPGAYLHLLEGMPENIKAICAVVQGLLLHVNDASLFDYEIPEERKAEMQARSVEKMLQQIYALNA